jgi:hypothetical protein
MSVNLMSGSQLPERVDVVHIWLSCLFSLLHNPFDAIYVLQCDITRALGSV